MTKRMPTALAVTIAALLCAASMSNPAFAAEGPLVGSWVETAPTGSPLPPLPPMPTPRANVASAVVNGNSLIVIGGQTGAGNDTVVGTVEVYRSQAAGGAASTKNIWQTDTSLGGVHVPMPAPRAGASAAVIPDPYDNAKKYVAVIGGIGPDVFDEDDDADVAEIVSSKAVQVYDFFGRTWNTAKALKAVAGWGAGLVKVPERFTDLNSDGDWNPGEAFTDSNANGTFDANLHLLNGVCTVDPAGCGYPNNNAYEIYFPGRRDNPATSGTDEALEDSWSNAFRQSPPPEREPAGVLITPLPQTSADTRPRYIYKFGGGTGGVLSTQGAIRKDVDTPGADWEEIKTMPAARVGHVAIVLPGKDSTNASALYPAVFGGGTGTQAASDTIFLYQPDAGGWITDSTMNVAGTDRPRGGRFAIGIMGDSVYVAGGLDSSGAVDGTMLRAALNTGNTPVPPAPETPLFGTWENVQAPIPTSRTRSAFAQIGSKLYIFGGADGTSAAQYYEDSFSDDVEVYDIAANSWTTSDTNKGTQTETPMPVYFTKGVAAALQDASGKTKIYITGGAVDANKNDSFADPEDSSPSGNLYVYDPEAKTWGTGAPMPTPRTYPGVFVYENKMHVVGGTLATNTPAGSPHEVYDPVTDTWTTEASGTPFGGRQGGAMTVANHGAGGVWAYWLGGSTVDTQTAQSARLNLSVPGSNWEPIANVPVGGVSNARAITVADGDIQYPSLFGGDFGPVACAYDKAFHYFSEFHPDATKVNTWAADPAMVVPEEGKVVRSNFAIAQYQGYVYVAGGDAGNCDLVNRTLRTQILSTAEVEVTGVGDAKWTRVAADLNNDGQITPGEFRKGDPRPDGVKINFTAPQVVNLVPLSETGFFYMESPDRSAGIRVETLGSLPVLGDTVLVSGRLGTNTNGERVLLNATVTATGNNPVEPVSIINGSVGGAGFAGSTGLPLAYGLDNTGILVKATGKITRIDFAEEYFLIDDGSKVDSATTAPGVRVIRTGLLPFLEGDWAIVTGVVTSQIVDGKTVRVLRGREDPSEMELFSP